MSTAERQRTGVDKLSPEQHQALSEWLWNNRQVLAEKGDHTSVGESGGDDKAITKTTELSEQDARIQAEVEKRVAEELARQKTERMGREKAAQRQTVSARIAGDFKGWRGATEFTLDNGQVWKQIDGETYYVRKKHNPEVELVPMALGSWGLRLKSTGRTVKVKRIR